VFKIDGQAYNASIQAYYNASARPIPRTGICDYARAAVPEVASEFELMLQEYHSERKLNVSPRFAEI
jgi:hypothetical protein